VNKIMPAPNSMENRPRIVPSKNIEFVHQAARFGPVPIASTFGEEYGNPNSGMFTSIIPHSATPRMMSTELIRLMCPVGVRCSAAGITLR